MLPSFHPKLVEAPSGEGAAIADGAVEHHLLKLPNRDRSQSQIVLFGVWIGFGGRQSGSKENMLLLMREAVGDPKRPETGHALSGQARFLPQFSPRQFLGVDSGGLPTPLGQLQAAILHGVAKLFDKVDGFALNGQDDGAVVFIHHAIDAVDAVAALHLVLTDAQPGVPVHFTATEGFDAHDYECTANLGPTKRRDLIRRAGDLRISSGEETPMALYLAQGQ